MNKRSWLVKLIAFMTVLAMMLGPVGLLDKSAGNVTNRALAEENEVTDEAAVQAAAEEAARKAEEERRAEEARKAEEERKAEEARKAEEERKAEEARKAEEEAARKAEEENKPEPEPEPQPEPEPEPEPEDKDTVVTEVDSNSELEQTPEDEEDEDFGEDEDEDFGDDDDLFEFDDDEVGDVSEDLLEQFNNPDCFEQFEFSGSADIRLKNEKWDENWDGRVVLIADVKDADLSYRLVWEANDGDSRGWFTVGSGSEYSYTLTKDNIERESSREYRVVMFTVD